MASMHTLKRNTKNATAKRVGRGGKRGKTAGRGHKGQKAHGGHGIRPEIRDMIKKIPKLRGHGKNRSRTVVYKLPCVAINVAQLDDAFAAGDAVNPETLAQKGFTTIREAQKCGIKILGNGEISTKVAVTGCTVSDSARTKIEKAGGSVA